MKIHHIAFDAWSEELLWRELAARGALRVGAGLVTVASPPNALMVNAAHLTAIMLKASDGAAGLAKLLEDRRLNSVVIGPALGVGGETREMVMAALKSGAACVLDADALTAFKDDPEALFARLHDRCVLTPHYGEFERLFPGLADETESKVTTVRTAAARVVIGGGMVRSWERIRPQLTRALSDAVPFPPEVVIGAYPFDAPLVGALDLATNAYHDSRTVRPAASCEGAPA